MYYIEQDINMLNGINSRTYGFHYISSFHVDYINEITEVKISSTDSKEKWIEDGYCSPHVNYFELQRVPCFDEDPNHFILKKLVTLPLTVFFGLKVKKDYDLKCLPIHKH